MTFQQIKYIIEIAKSSSISKASKNLYVAQPYLSKSLKELEEEMGIIIFKRTSKGVFLTSEGKEFLNYVKPLLEQQDKILNIYSNKKEKRPFYMEISTQRYPFVIKALVEVLDINNISEDYNIHIKEKGMYDVIEDIYQKKSSMGIIFISSSTENFIKKYLFNKDLKFIEISKVTPCIFFNKSHPMASKENINIKEMSAYPFASFEETSSFSMEFAEEYFFYDLNLIKKRIFVSDRATMMNILTNTNAFSIGTGILPKGYAGLNLISKKISEYQHDLCLGAVVDKEVTLSKEQKQFIFKIKSIIEDNKII